MICDVTRDEAEVMLKGVQKYVNTHNVHIKVTRHQDGRLAFEIMENAGVDFSESVDRERFKPKVVEMMNK